MKMKCESRNHRGVGHSLVGRKSSIVCQTAMPPFQTVPVPLPTSLCHFYSSAADLVLAGGRGRWGVLDVPDFIMATVFNYKGPSVSNPHLSGN